MKDRADSVSVGPTLSLLLSTTLQNKPLTLFVSLLNYYYDYYKYIHIHIKLQVNYDSSIPTEEESDVEFFNFVFCSKSLLGMIILGYDYACISLC